MLEQRCGCCSSWKGHSGRKMQRRVKASAQRYLFALCASAPLAALIRAHLLLLVDPVAWTLSERRCRRVRAASPCMHWKRTFGGATRWHHCAPAPLGVPHYARIALPSAPAAASFFSARFFHFPDCYSVSAKGIDVLSGILTSGSPWLPSRTWQSCCRTSCSKAACCSRSFAERGGSAIESYSVSHSADCFCLCVHRSSTPPRHPFSIAPPSKCRRKRAQILCLRQPRLPLPLREEQRRACLVPGRCT